MYHTVFSLFVSQLQAEIDTPSALMEQFLGIGWNTFLGVIPIIPQGVGLGIQLDAPALIAFPEGWLSMPLPVWYVYTSPGSNRFLMRGDGFFLNQSLDMATNSTFKRPLCPVLSLRMRAPAHRGSVLHIPTYHKVFGGFW